MNKAIAKKTTRKAGKAGTSKASAADKRKAFVEAYFANGENGTQAAIDAGFSARTAAQAASRLLRNVQVLRTIEQRREQLCANLEITTDRILKERARLAFYDPRKLFDADGKPIPIHLLDDDTAAALTGLDVHEEYAGTGEDRVFIGFTKKYKLATKDASLTALEKIRGLYEKDNKQKADPLAALLEKLSGNVLGVATDATSDDVDDAR